MIEATKEPERIRRLYCHPDISQGIFEDREDSSAVVKCVADDNALCFVFINNGVDVGVAVFYPYLRFWLTDVGFLRKFRGKWAFEHSKFLLDSMVDLYPRDPIAATIKLSNKASARFACSLGFQRMQTGPSRSLYIYNPDGINLGV